MGTNAYSYAYDPIGNRTAVTNNGEAVAYTANILNQCTNLQSTAFSLQPFYDLDGNLLTNGPWAYAWDAENRLASACSNSVLLVTNVYDHQSRRIRKEVFARANATCNYEPVTCNDFLHDGWNVIREVRSQNSGVSTNYYTWGLDLSGSVQGAGCVGGLLAVTTVSSASAQPAAFYPCYDANGNVTDYLDSNENNVAHREYSAFGETTALTGPLVDSFTFWWSTKPWCPVTGLSEYEFRKYHPDLGRWVSRDPIGEGGGINLAAFVNNSPLTYIDVLGQKKCCCKENGKECESGSEFIWRGTCFYSSLGGGVGVFSESVWNLTCHLTSNLTPDCKQYHAVMIDAFGVVGSISLPLSVSASFFEFDVALYY